MLVLCPVNATLLITSTASRRPTSMYVYLCVSLTSFSLKWWEKYNTESSCKPSFSRNSLIKTWGPTTDHDQPIVCYWLEIIIFPACCWLHFAVSVSRRNFRCHVMCFSCCNNWSPQPSLSFCCMTPLAHIQHTSSRAEGENEMEKRVYKNINNKSNCFSACCLIWTSDDSWWQESTEWNLICQHIYTFFCSVFFLGLKFPRSEKCTFLTSLSWPKSIFWASAFNSN